MECKDKGSSSYGVFGDMLAAAKIGSWKIEIDEGKEPRMYVDVTMRNLIAIPADSCLSPEAVYHAWYDRIDSLHYDAIAEGIGYMLNGEMAEIQYPWPHPDGRTIVVRCGGVRDGSYGPGTRIAGIHQWVTTMRHVDRTLETQQKRLSALATLSNQCICVFDVDLCTGMYEIIKHPGTTKVMDRKDKRWDIALGRDFAEECYPESREVMRNIGSIDFLRSELKHADHREYSYMHRMSVGNTLHRRCTVLAIDRDEKGDATRVLVDFVAVDDRQAKIIEQQKLIRQQQRDIEVPLSQAEAANRAKTAFLFNMSHDIRTPMNAIKGFNTIALANLDNPGIVKDSLLKSEKAGGLMLSLIDSILDMSRIDAGKARISETVGDVMFSFLDIEATMKSLADSRNVRLKFEFGKITDRYVYVDYERCTRVFVNLISNATKYSKDCGWVNVKCEQLEETDETRALDAKCRKATASDDRRAWFRYTIEDNGIGMSEDFQKHVFEEFSRERNSTTSGIQGTGLDLALCKAFVELMGGVISCRSRQNIGTLFTVELPFRVQIRKEYIDPDTRVVVAAGKHGLVPVEPTVLSGMRVLLVEDNALNREVAEYVLKSNGFEVESAEDGSFAVNLVKGHALGFYDFILMDIQMPVMGGYEATRLIRGLGYSRPIIALSANAFEEDREASLAAGMNAHVAKPFKSAELMALLCKYV